MDNSFLLDPSGCDEFDRARRLLRDHREDEALDWFEVAYDVSKDRQVRASAAAHVAALLLGFGRPWEVVTFAEHVRVEQQERALGDVLEACACIQLGDAKGALELIGEQGPVPMPKDRWYPSSTALAHGARVRALVLADRLDDARRELDFAIKFSSDAPEVWEAVASMAAVGALDVRSCVQRLQTARIVDLFGWLASAPANGLDAIAEALWERSPGDSRILAAVTLFGWRVDPARGLLWSIRLLEHGVTQRSPLLERAEMPQVEPSERVRAGIVGVALDESRARLAVEHAVDQVDDDELVSLLCECLDRPVGEPSVADGFVVGAATTTVRCLAMVPPLWSRKHRAEALAVLVAGLSMRGADDLTPERFDALVARDVRLALAAYAAEQGDSEVAELLRSVPERAEI